MNAGRIMKRLQKRRRRPIDSIEICFDPRMHIGSRALYIRAVLYLAGITVLRMPRSDELRWNIFWHSRPGARHGGIGLSRTPIAQVLRIAGLKRPIVRDRF